MKKLYKIRLISSIIILIAAIAGATGYFYAIKIFDLQFGPLLQKNIVNISIASIIILITLISITTIFGRIYCSLICPLGIFQETICILTKKKHKKTNNFPIKYILAIPAFGLLLFGSSFIIRYLEPYTIFTSAFSLSRISLIIIAIITCISIFKGRFFCTNICPVGTVLGLISQCAPYKINIEKNICVSCGSCEKNCQAECIDSKEKTVDNEACIKCLKCLEICPKNAIHYSTQPQEKKFSPERRKLLITGVAAIIVGAALKTGLNLIKTADKIKNIILPPGAKNPEKFLSECFNCNLCVNNCTEKIIKPADSDFSAPHIEYEKKGHCKFDCKKCTDVCPTGAIKRINIEEKQKTKIATAKINKEKCIKCGLCEIKCPKKAVNKTDNEYDITDTKCIGCADCASHCPVNAIEIFAVSEQKVI